MASFIVCLIGTLSAAGISKLFKDWLEHRGPQTIYVGVDLHFNIKGNGWKELKDRDPPEQPEKGDEA